MIDAQTLTQTLTSLVPPLGRAGFVVLATEPNKVWCMTPIEGNTNHLGSVYAGTLFSFAEAAAGAVLMVSLDITRVKLMVRSSRIEFHRLALTDIHARPETDPTFIQGVLDTIERDGKAFFDLAIDILDTDGQKVATATFDYRLKGVG